MTLAEWIISTDEKDFADHLRNSRTVSEAEVWKAEREHDRDHWTPEELGYGAVHFVPIGAH